MVTEPSALLSTPGAGLNKQAHDLKLVTNFSGTRLKEMELFLSALNSDEIRAYQHAFHISSMRKGPSGKSEHYKLNPQGDLFALRRWAGMVRQESNAVMLIYAEAIREAPLGVALALAEVLKTGKPVLGVGINTQMERQLKANIDLSMGRIDPIIRADNALRNSLRNRAARGNSFFNTVRRLVEMRFFPKHLRERLASIGSSKGASNEFTEVQIINMCLMSDLLSRYEHMLQAFQGMVRAGTRIRQLSSMFGMLMGDASVQEVLPIFESMLDTEENDPHDITTHDDLFGRLMQYVKSDEGVGRGVKEEDRLGNLFSRLGEATLKLRAARDPMLWRQVQFIHPTTNAEKKLALIWGPFLREAKNLKDDENHKPEGAIIQELSSALYETAQIANNLRTTLEGGQPLAVELLSLVHSETLPTSSLQYVYADHRELLEKRQIERLVRRGQVNAAQLNRHATMLQQRLNGLEEKAKYLSLYILNSLKRHEDRLGKVHEGVFSWHMATGALYVSMHLEGSKLSQLERLCAVQLGRTRLGLDIQLKSNSWDSIEVMPSKNALRLGQFKNDPALVAAVYTEFISQRVAHIVRKMLNNKLPYLRAFHGPWLMQWLHSEVIHSHGLPISLEQMGWILRLRGVFSQGPMGFAEPNKKVEESTGQAKTKTKNAAPKTMANNRAGERAPSGNASTHKDFIPDPFLVLEEDLEHSLLHNEEILQKTRTMEKQLRKTAIQFKNLIDELRTAGKNDARALIWSFYKKGIYNLHHPLVKQEMRKTPYYGGVREIVAQVISRNQKVFNQELEREGVTLLLPPELHYLLVIGSSYTFASKGVTVRYQMERSVSPIHELPTVSQEFHKDFIHIISEDDSPLATQIHAFGHHLQHCDAVWAAYSRRLLFSFIDRIITAVLEAKLRSSTATPKTLSSMGDSMLLCVGPSLTHGHALNFTKILKKPENMGSFKKNPHTSNITMGEMATETRIVSDLEQEMHFMQALAEDILHVCRGLSYLKQEGDLVNEFERLLVELIQDLNTPLRLLLDEHAKAISQHAKDLLECVRDMRSVPGSQVEVLIVRLERRLKTQRSDGINVSLKTFEGLVFEELQKENHSTPAKPTAAPKDIFIFRFRQLLHLQSVLRQKRVVVMSPEGHKKQHIEYAVDIIQGMQKLRGNRLEIFLDRGQLNAEQVLGFSSWVKPGNLFDMKQL